MPACNDNKTQGWKPVLDEGGQKSCTQGMQQELGAIIYLTQFYFTETGVL